ncbi:HPr family phosphocarrier protein [Lachnospiraceae bacterium MD308]|nr:HPr family phosphocarrier protein [Lachnospiraceae bacterium MD308]
MNNTIRVKLNNIENAQKFVEICNQFEDIDIDYIIGKYSVDAKSIMGVLSTSLGRTANIELNKADRNSVDLFCNLIRCWIMEE